MEAVSVQDYINSSLEILHAWSVSFWLPCIADEVNALVIDLGSHTVKAGYAGEDTPKALFPSVSLYSPQRVQLDTLPLCMYSLLGRQTPARMAERLLLLRRWWAAYRSSQPVPMGHQRGPPASRGGSCMWAPRRWATGETTWR